MIAPTFTVPHGLARRLAMSPELAYARLQAALIARVYRAVSLDGVRDERDERFDRNRLARGNARRYVKLWKAQNRVA